MVFYGFTSEHPGVLETTQKKNEHELEQFYTTAVEWGNPAFLGIIVFNVRFGNLKFMISSQLHKYFGRIASTSDCHVRTRKNKKIGAKNYVKREIK